MKFTIVNRSKVYSATLRAERPFALIQFTDPYQHFATYSDEGCRIALKFKVHDVDNCSDIRDICFTDNDAKRIIKTILPKKDELKEIICQCDAGISRSSGCAAALSLAITGSDKEIFNQKRYVPNRLIYRKILDAWQEYES